MQDKEVGAKNGLKGPSLPNALAENLMYKILDVIEGGFYIKIDFT